MAEKLRVAIIGAQRNRVRRVVEVVSEKCLAIEETAARPPVRLEFLPCVATFGSYDDDAGKPVRYLSNIDYLGKDGNGKPSSLAPFFDEEVDKQKKFHSLSGVAIGCGIESDQDVSSIQSFIMAISGGQNDEKVISVECVKPNSGFATMREENDAYRALDAEEKRRQSSLGLIGPGKMAQFAYELALRLMDDAFPLPDTLHTDTGVPEGEVKTSEEEQFLPRMIDASKPRYACRMCRTILFGEEDLESPRHVPSRRYGNVPCESLFLHSPLDWMGSMDAFEGKLNCPNDACHSKLGNWNWHGAQCSCGAWITPGIRIPKSKIDLIQANNHQTLEDGPILATHAVVCPIMR